MFRSINSKLLVLIWLGQVGHGSGAQGQSISFLYKAMTANAGGQQAYSLKYQTKKGSEWSAFLNYFLLTGAFPLTGIGWVQKFDVCNKHCYIDTTATIGGGLSTAGPYLEVGWQLNPLWLFRFDFVTHFYFSGIQPIVWNYPLWLGVTLPF